MDRATANEACKAAGVADVPAGVDPQEWLDDNDVFFDLAGAVERAQQKIAAEACAPRDREAADDHERIEKKLQELTEGLVKTTVWPYRVDRWKPLDSGIWSAASAAPYNLSVWDTCERPQPVRHEYGNAVLYFVPPSMETSCAEEYWAQQVQTGTRAKKTFQGSPDPIKGLAWAAQRILTIAETYGDRVYGGEDCLRVVEWIGREKLQEIADLEATS